MRQTHGLCHFAVTTGKAPESAALDCRFFRGLAAHWPDKRQLSLQQRTGRRARCIRDGVTGQHPRNFLDPLGRGKGGDG